MFDEVTLARPNDAAEEKAAEQLSIPIPEASSIFLGGLFVLALLTAMYVTRGNPYLPDRAATHAVLNACAATGYAGVDQIANTTRRCSFINYCSPVRQFLRAGKRANISGP